MNTIPYRWLNDSDARPITPTEFDALLLSGEIRTLGAEVLGVSDREFEILYLNGRSSDCRRQNLRAIPRAPFS